MAEGKVPQPKSTQAKARLLAATNLVKKLPNKYAYEELTSKSQTRLLHLLPGAEDDPIICELFPIELQELKVAKDEEPIPWKALSYHWGSEKNPREIKIQTKKWMLDNALAHSMKAPLPPMPWYRIQQNLFHALKAMRDVSLSKLLWIDALCINQEDVTERTRQLGFIDRVYELAPDVIIWLGPGNKRHEIAFDFIKRIAVTPDVRALASDKDFVDRWMALVELMQLSWFSRKWVVQELALAKTAQVQCGRNLETTWENLRDAIGLMERYNEQIRILLKENLEYDHDYHALPELLALEAMQLVDIVHNMFRRNKYGAAFQPNLDFEYLISALANFSSSDPRDTINAFWNIARETRIYRKVIPGVATAIRNSDTGDHTKKPPPKPTYDINVPLVEIYIEFFKWIMETSGHIDLLCRKWALPERLKRPEVLTGRKEYVYLYPELSILPSWIQTVESSSSPLAQATALRKPGRTQEVSLVGLPGQRPYNACNSLPSIVVFGTIPPSQATSEPDDTLNTGAAAAETQPHAGPSGGADARPNGLKRKHSAMDVQSELVMSEAEREQKRHAASLATRLPNLGIVVDVANLAHVGNVIHRLDEDTATPLTSEARTTMALLRQALLGYDVSIQIEGTQIGTVSWHTSSMSEGTVHEDVIGKLAPNWKKEMRSEDENLWQFVPDMLWRGLVAERGSNRDSPPPMYYRACRRIVSEHLSPTGAINIKELLRKGTVSDVEKEYLQRVHEVTFKRSFLEGNRMPDWNNDELENDKLLGFGPGNIKENDLICILFGCSVPVILRRSTDTEFDQGVYYKLIGECYIYGFMDGDAIRAKSKEELGKATRTYRLF